VAQTGEVGARLLACAREIASGLERGRSDADRGERAGAQQPHQQLGVLAVGLDPVGGRSRRLRGRNHVTRSPAASAAR
jgi:hypothetical protein